VAENLQLRSNLKEYEEGRYSGKGPSQSELSKRSYAEQEKRAQAFSNELLKYMDNEENAPLPKSHESFVDVRASHRHDPTHRSKKIPKQKPSKRPCPLRNTRSKTFVRVLDIAKKMKSVKVKSETIVSQHERHFTVPSVSGVDYEVEICSTPNCSCRYCSDRDVCSHIVWLLVNRFQLHEDSTILHQRGYTGHEMEVMFSANGGMAQGNPTGGSMAHRKQNGKNQDCEGATTKPNHSST